MLKGVKEAFLHGYHKYFHPETELETKVMEEIIELVKGYEV
jgi:hypothetical protein